MVRYLAELVMNILLFTNSVTDMHEPVHELIRMVRIFSSPWEEKSAALKKLHDDFHKKRRQLDVAVRRLTLLDAMVRIVKCLLYTLIRTPYVHTKY